MPVFRPPPARHGAQLLGNRGAGGGGRGHGVDEGSGSAERGGRVWYWIGGKNPDLQSAYGRVSHRPPAQRPGLSFVRHRANNYCSPRLRLTGFKAAHGNIGAWDAKFITRSSGAWAPGAAGRFTKWRLRATWPSHSRVS